jgi:hypothetical protein
MTETTLLAKDCGFEIHHRDEQVLMVNRKTFGFAIATWIFGGLCFICTGNFAVWLGLGFSQDKLSGMAFIGVGVLLAFALVFFFAARACYKAYARRRDLPAEQVAGTLIAETGSGVLTTKEGTVLSTLPEVSTKIKLDMFDSTKGLMRLVVLSWNGGNAHVFKTNSGKEAKRVVQALKEMGIG